jgi:hypothetical protein
LKHGFLLLERTSKRRISQVAFNVKAILGVRLCVGVIQLPKAWLLQAAVASKDLALLADDRPRGDGGQLVLSIGFVKCMNRHIQAAHSLKAMIKLTLISDANEDKVRMWKIWRKESADFNNRMARLDNLLRKWQVGPDEDVNVRRGVALREFHGWLLLRDSQTSLNYTLRFLSSKAPATH